MKTYAYVKTETCAHRAAATPGGTTGREERPVAKHGDWTPWTFGKQRTLALYNETPTAANAYRRECAWLVMELLWPDLCHAE